MKQVNVRVEPHECKIITLKAFNATQRGMHPPLLKQLLLQRLQELALTSCRAASPTPSMCVDPSGAQNPSFAPAGKSNGGGRPPIPMATKSASKNISHPGIHSLSCPLKHEATAELWQKRRTKGGGPSCPSPDSYTIYCHLPRKLFGIYGHIFHQGQNI